MNAMSQIDVNAVPLKDKVYALCKKYPKMTTREIAELCSASTRRVGEIRCELKMPRLPKGESFIKHLSQENADWLKDESHKAGVSVLDLIGAIITDARLDD